MKVPTAKKRKKVIMEDEELELEMIQSYYNEYNKSNSDNIEEKEENVKSLKELCKEKLASIRFKRLYVKTVLPVTNTITYTDYNRKSALEKFQFLKENSRQVLSHYQNQWKNTKQNEANQAEITQYTNQTLSYDMWKSALVKSLAFKPKKEVQQHLKIHQIETDKIPEIDRVPAHKTILL